MGALVPLPINPPPGVIATESQRVAEGRWILPMDKVRFVHGRPQKIGGNTRVTSTAMSGTPRATLCWQDFLQNGYVAAGTYRKLYAFDSSFSLNDITPFRATGTLGSNPFTSTSGSSSVQVSHTAHGVNVGDTVIFSGAWPGGVPNSYAGFTTGNYWFGATEGSLAAYLSAAGFTFTRATAAEFVNSSGNLASASTGVQRFDYDQNALTLKGTLLEGASTNLVLQSNSLSTTWTTSAGDTLSQNVTGPDGVSNSAWTHTAGNSGFSSVQQSVTLSGTTFTFSVWAKAGTDSWLALGGNDTGNLFASFNVSNGTIGTVNWSQAGSPTGTISNAKIVQYPNGWYRCSIEWTGSTPTIIRLQTCDANGSLTATTGKTLLLWGAQVEALAFPTSYIATTSGTVTRNADNVSRTRGAAPTSITKLLTAFTPVGINSEQVLWSCNDGTANNEIKVRQGSNTHLHVTVTAGGVQQADLDLGAVAANTQFSLAFTASAANFVASLNGAAVVSVSSGSMPTGNTSERLGGGLTNGNEWFADVSVDAEWTSIIATSAQLQTLSSSPNLNGSNLPSWLPYMGGTPSMNGTFICATVVNTNSYTVNTATTATNSESYGGTSVAYEYEIAVGTELGAFGQGWGTGPWGLGTWGTPRGSSTIFFEPRVWSLDYFGQVLVASYNGGSLWFFDPTQNQPWPRAVATFGGNPVSGAPTNIRALFVSPERFIFTACGSMVVNVCSQGDPTTWTPASSNTAFARTLQVGSKLVSGRALAPYLSMVWSDNAAYLFQYTGSQFLYNSSMVGRDCGLVSPNAVAVVDGIPYWMGPENFYFYNGSVQPMPNVEDVRNYIFPNVPKSVSFQASAVYIPEFHEIRWYYTTTGNTNPSNYVAFHINDQCWSTGTANFYSSVGVTTGHASGSHFTAGDTSPIMAGTDGYLYQADESGQYDDNGQPLGWTLTLAPSVLKEGTQSMDLEGIRFDFFQQSGAITATVTTFDELTDAAPMDSQTQTVPAIGGGLTDFRVSGRFLGLQMSQSVLGGYMRFGKPTALVRPTGTRRG